MSVRHQCRILSLNRSNLYYKQRPESAKNLELMRLLDEQFTCTPFYGTRRMTAHLRKLGHEVNRKRVQNLMRKMGLEAIFPGPNLSKRNMQHKVYPYLLGGLKVTRANQVWSTDITYIPINGGFAYLVAVIDWHTRYVLSWRLSTSLELGFCVDALEEALSKGKPEIFNTDQGSQFTSEAFTSKLLSAGIKISMDSKGRALDNIFVERLWRSLKYENIYLNAYQSVSEARQGIGEYFEFYNNRRLHQSLEYKTPFEMNEAQAVA